MITGAAALTLALGGCATTVRSDVTTFQQWPAQMQDKSYSFTAPSPQEDTLELRTYQNLVRGQLARLGFNEAQGTPALHVSMRFMTTEIPVQVVEPAFGGFYPYGGRYGFYGPRRFGGYYGSPFFAGGPYFGGFGGPAYDCHQRRQAAVRRHCEKHQPRGVDAGADAGTRAKCVRRLSRAKRRSAQDRVEAAEGLIVTLPRPVRGFYFMSNTLPSRL
jgi:hypothetical protein